MTESGKWLPRTAAMAQMDHHAIIRVHGPDACALLQGQLSNDIQSLDAQPAQLATFNSPKGRVLAFLRVVKPAPDTFWLVVDRDILDVFVQRLKMFVLRSKVDIDVVDEIGGCAIVGNGAADALNESGWPVPETGHAAAHADCVVFALPGPVPRFEIFGATNALPAVDVEQASGKDLARWDILFRLPRINDANRDQHVAQHLDLDELGAISFNKGCYTGQEIIARMKYLGKVKKRTRIFTGSDANAGDSVRNAEDRSVGEVVNSVDADGEQLILASVNLDADAPLSVNGREITPASA